MRQVESFTVVSLRLRRVDPSLEVEAGKKGVKRRGEGFGWVIVHNFLGRGLRSPDRRRTVEGINSKSVYAFGGSTRRHGEVM